MSGGEMPPSKSSPSEFDRLEAELHRCQIAGALPVLVEMLRTRGSEHELFEALKMQLRHDLGLPLFPDPSEQLPPDLEDRLESGLLAACREVGTLLMQRGRVREGWLYLRAVAPGREFADLLRGVTLTDESMEEVIEVAFHEGVDPAWGFQLILQHFGTCNAITALSGYFTSLSPALRREVAGQVVRHLYEELRINLVGHLQREGVDVPEAAVVSELVERLSQLNAKEQAAYHVDISHLTSVLRFAEVLDDRELWERSRQLAHYGSRLDPSLKVDGEEPFVDFFAHHEIYFQTLLGENEEYGIDFFRQRAEAVDAHREGTSAAEVYVDLLHRCRRPQEAISALLQHIPPGTHTTGRAPSLLELCRAAGDYSSYLQYTRQQNNLLGFAMGLFESTDS